eukprot:INCI16264.1.p2 GENE.INCI16264.1~~INCI16264.1.p2  ORF type:complete len:165 (+),score=4.45 INCI16264.1:122-616(+)
MTRPSASRSELSEERCVQPAVEFSWGGCGLGIQGGARCCCRCRRQLEQDCVPTTMHLIGTLTLNSSMQWMTRVSAFARPRPPQADGVCVCVCVRARVGVDVEKTSGGCGGGVKGRAIVRSITFRYRYSVRTKSVGALHGFIRDVHLVNRVPKNTGGCTSPRTPA